MSAIKLPRICRDKIDLIFEKCTSVTAKKKTAVDFVSTAKIFWSVLNNSLTLVDLVGVWNIVAPSGETVASPDDTLEIKLFHEFFNGIAKIKYPTLSAYEFTEKLLEDFNTSVGPSVYEKLNTIDKMFDRNVIYELFKMDLVMKKTYTSYAGENVISIDGGLAWEEVKNLSIGMELNGFIDFAEAYTIIPEQRKIEECSALFTEVLSLYPLSSNDKTSPTATLLFPQFELLICLLAVQLNDVKFPSYKGRSNSLVGYIGNNTFVKKIAIENPVSKAVAEFFKEIKMGKPSAAFVGSTRRKNHNTKVSSTTVEYRSYSLDEDEDLSIKSMMTNILPTGRCVDQYNSSLKHNRQGMLSKMQNLFDEVEDSLIKDSRVGKGPAPAVMTFIAQSRHDEILSLNPKQRFASKPVVISDAIPIPAECCSQAVEQLLQSALVHHNLSSFQESLVFIDAARKECTTGSSSSSNDQLDKAFIGHSSSAEQIYAGDPPFPLEMYFILSEGNLYRSCGEDEQAFVCYMKGWRKAQENNDREWDVIFVNSIGVLAYYSVRYDIALMCFSTVVRYRETEYGSESSDTATALNNEGCSLYCMQERGESRLRFERCWLVGSKVLGHRAPRSILMWQNLEKARRSNMASESKTPKEELLQRVHLRGDAEKLLVGGAFSIKAIAPMKIKKSVGKKKGGKKKKK